MPKGDPSETVTLDTALQTAEQLQEQTNKHCERTLERLNHDEITSDTLTVQTEITVSCECGRTYDIAEFLTDPTCECQQE